MDSDPRRLAVLIDGDFIDPAHFGRVLAWVARHNEVVIRRIYGDHKKLDYWKKCIGNHGIEPVPNYTNYKNAADIILTLNAAEIFYSRKDIDGFCIVTSDNDFAGLVKWLRDKKAFVAAIWSSRPDNHKPSFGDECDVFKYVDDLPLPSADSLHALLDWKDAVKESIRMATREDGWALLSDVGNMLKATGREFDLSDYCHGKLFSLIESCSEFETKAGPERVRLRPQ